jgi:hypothetical protein
MSVVTPSELLETQVVVGEGMIASKSGDAGNHSKAVSKSKIEKVVAIPFPVRPRQVRYGPLAKIFDFLAWKNCHSGEASEADDSTSKTLEQIMKLSLAEQKLWLIRGILEIYDFGDRKEFYKLYEILCEKSPDSA